MRRSLCLLVILVPFLVLAQQPTRSFEGASRSQIDDDETYVPHIEHPAYEKDGPVLLLDRAHGNSHFDSAFAKLVSADGYQVVASRTTFTYDQLSKARVLVIMNAGLFSTRAWLEDPQPLFTDVEASAVRDWIVAGGSLLFASGSMTPEAGQMLLDRLGVEFNFGRIKDDDLFELSPASQPKLPIRQPVFSREKKLLSTHSIMAGRSESERIGAVSFSDIRSLSKFPKNAVALMHCSEKAAFIRQDDLVKRQVLEATRALEKGAKEMQTVELPKVVPVPVPGIPVAVAFTLGKGRVVVMGGGSALSSIVRRSELMGNPVSEKIGLGSADNQKFTLNTMHWLTGVLE